MQWGSLITLYSNLFPVYPQAKFGHYLGKLCMGHTLDILMNKWITWLIQDHNSWSMDHMWVQRIQRSMWSFCVLWFWLKISEIHVILLKCIFGSQMYWDTDLTDPCNPFIYLGLICKDLICIFWSWVKISGIPAKGSMHSVYIFGSVVKISGI